MTIKINIAKNIKDYYLFNDPLYVISALYCYAKSIEINILKNYVKNRLLHIAWN